MVRLAIWANRGAVADMAASVCMASTLHRIAPMIIDKLCSLPVGSPLWAHVMKVVDEKLLQKESWIKYTQ